MEEINKQTNCLFFISWLCIVRKHVNDLYEDLRDGHNLISLLEVLSGDTLPREKGRMRFHRLQNVQIALDYLKRRQVKLVNIRNDDITDGNPKLTLGLIWTIILHFQISDIHVTGESEDMTAKERLLLWSQQMTEGYVGVRCDNFTTSWRDGRLFNALIHKYRPDLVDLSKVSAQSIRSNLEQAFGVAEQLGVARLLDPEDVDVSTPDEKSVITYVSTLYDVFPKVPEGVEGINANDVDVKWVEYQNMINYLSQWIKHNVSVMCDRNFPSNPVELKALYSQYLHFKESEIPPKENEKTKIKHLYKMLEVWIEFGRIQLPQGYHPNDVEKEWGKLIVAMLEREKSLRPEVDRLEMLQQIANRVQRDCVAGEDKLALARTSLQSDAKRLESGIQFQNEAEIAGYLLECENLLRQQVVDIQILLDGNFYLADQLVQRVSKLRDNLLALRTECSSVYSKGRSTLSTSLSPALTPGMTPTLTPGLTPGLQPALVGGGEMETGVLQHLKQMHIRKPMLKSSLVDPNLSEEEVNLKFVQDLLNWVEDMQLQLDRGEWGSDLPSVESHSENHRNVHKAIEDFQMSLKEAKISEVSFIFPFYWELLCCLKQSSEERQKHLDSLHDFVSHATQELIWLNEKEEEEVAFDWSERNSNISRKKDYHAVSPRTAYKAAMQTQWSWVLQLCYCVEQHLKENAVYFDFFNDAKESMDYLKSLQDSISRKYGCDRTSGLHRLEDLIQESMDEKEQLLQYRSTVAGLVGRAKSVGQLKPRNPESPVRTSIPVKAICDYRQIEITIYKDDECVLANNSHRAKWKVISPSGNEAMVPSVCFSVPPPNKEAVDMASRIEQLYQNVLALWHRSHINMKSVVSWHYLMMDIHTVRKSTVASIKTMLPGEHQQVLSSLQSHFEEFLEDSEESEVFTVADCAQLEREVLASKEYYEELLKSAEREEHEESVYNLFISEVRNFRMRVEAHEEQLIRQIRTPLDRDDLQASMQRITEQERKKAELDRLKEDLEVLKEKCEVFLRQAANSPSVPTLSSELSVLTQSMAQVYSMCSIYLEKLKAVSLVVKHSQSAEALVKLYEAKLCEEDAVNADVKSIDSVMSTLKQWRSEIDDRREVFHDLEDELQKARLISDRMFKTHNERDFDLDWHKEKAEQLGERWRNVHSQIENRSEDLEGISKSLKYYKDTYSSLDVWSKEMEASQRKAQENQPEDSKALAELLNQQKVLVAEIERKQSKIDECQKYSEQYSAGVKDYELQLMTYRAMVDSQHKSPVKRRRMQCSSDAIQQEFMDLRTRYTALVTLMTQYVKFASETLKRAEEDEVGRVSVTIKNLELELQKNDLQSQAESTKSQGRISIKKLIKTRIITQEIALKLQTGLITMEEVQASLAQFSGKPASIAGIYLESSKKKISFMEAADAGVIAKTYAIEFLEAQACTGAIIDPIIGESYSALEAVEKGIVSRDLRDKITEADKAVSGYPHGGKILSVFQAMEERIVDRHRGKGILEAQIATGGLIHPLVGMRVPLECAIEQGLINQATLQTLFDPVSNPKSFHNPETGQRAYYNELLKRCVYDISGGVYLLPFGEHPSFTPASSSRVSVINSTTGTEMSTYEAYKARLIDLRTYLFLSQQESDYRNGQLSIWELADLLISRNLASKVPDSPVAGLWVVALKKRLPIFKGVQQNLVDRLTAMKLLEAQACTGGICDPASGDRVQISEALRRGLLDDSFYQLATGGLIDPESHSRLSMEEAVQNCLIDKATAAQVKDDHSPVRNITCPKTKRKISYKEALEKSVHDSHTGLLLLDNKTTMFVLLKHIPINSKIRETNSETELLFSFQSFQNGLVDHCTGLSLLEAQLITSELILPEFRMCLDLEDALKHNLVDKPTYEQLHDLNEANKCLQMPPYASEPLPVVAAVNDMVISEHLAIKIIEIQLATGGLRLTYTGDCLSLQRAFQFGLIPHALYIQILQRQNTWKDLIDPNSAEKVSLIQLMQRSIVHEETGLRLLPVKSRKDGTISLTSGREVSILRAMHEGLIDRETMLRLLSAQLFAGGIVDTTSNCKFTVEEALSKGLIDQDTASGILSLQAKNGGIVNPHNGSRVTVDEAVQCDLMSSRSALLVLEKQRCFMGLLWPHSGEILTVSTSLQHEIITDKLASELLCHRHKIAALYIPENSEVIDIDSAAQDGLIDTYTKDLLKTLKIPDTFPSVEDFNDRFSTWLVMREIQLAGFQRSKNEMEIDQSCINAPSFSESNQLFISYLMMNSYMDPKSGQRLLIFDRQLNKMAKVLLEMSGLERAYAIHLLRAQVEEGGVLDVTSGKRYDLNAAVDKGLIDPETVLEVLALQLQQKDVIGNEAVTVSVLKQALAQGYVSSKVAKQIMEQQNLEGDSAFERTLITEDTVFDSSIVLDSEAVQKAITDSEGISTSSVSGPGLGILEEEVAEKFVQQESLEIVATHAVDLTDQRFSQESQRAENAVEPPAQPTNTTQMTSSLDSSHSLKIVSHTPSNVIPGTENLLVHKKISQDPKSSGLEAAPETKLEQDRGSTENEIEKNGMSYSVATDALPEVSLAKVENMAHCEKAVNQMVSPVPSDSGVSCSSQSDVCTDERKLDTLLSLVQLQEKTEGALTTDGSSLQSEVEDVSFNTVKDCKPFSSPTYVTLPVTPEHRAPESQADLHQEWNILSQPMDSFEASQSSMDQKGSDQCTTTENNFLFLFCLIQDLEKNLSGTRQHLEDTAFDVQNFVSEHAQFLNPSQNRQLLKSLSSTQRAFKELMDRVFTQSIFFLKLCKQKEFVAKLQEMCDDLTQTENRLIGHQQQAGSAKSALQKDIQGNASALNEVISCTKKFLDENRSKLTPEQIAAIEQKLEEAKSKANMLNQIAEESRKDLEKVVTTAIKQETEKVAAVEQLEESKNKIEGLLHWISNIETEKEMGGSQKDSVAKQNGNIETPAKRVMGPEDDPNGNELSSTDVSPEWSGEGEDSKDLDLDQQLEKVKARHQSILSQQQDLIIATQSAQALLDKQAEVLSPSEKEKLQRDIQELRGRYEASLTQAEQQMKQVQNVQEELRKFQSDCVEFEGWLQQAQEQMEELGAPAGQLEVLQENLQRQKSFYEDVISHKGDLRFITISGQKVLDVACSRKDSGEKEALPGVDTSGTCAAVKEKLDSATARYKDLHSQCNQLGTNLKDVVDKYKKYEDAAGGLLTWLNQSEEEARRQQSEPIAADPQTLQRQLEETKYSILLFFSSNSFHNSHLTYLQYLHLFSEDMLERYDNLSKSVSDRNEKLQMTLTRSLSVQDGLDEMMTWMDKVEESLGKEAQVPLDSAAIADALSKEVLEQDISSRQSSISAIQAKVKKFADTAEPAAAALLQTKMEGLTQRLSDACEKHKQKVEQMEQLKEKVEQFEKTSEKVQQFVLKRSQALSETDGPGRNVNELSALVQDMETLQTLSKELSGTGLEGSKALIQGKMANLSNTFTAFKDTIKEKEEEVSSCQDQLGEFKAAAGVLMKWLEETKDQVPAVQPNCSEQGLGKDLQKGFVCVLAPAELVLVQQNMLCVSEGHRNLGELLKARSSQLNSLLLKVRGAHNEAESMLQWLEDMKKTAESWSSEPTAKDSVKTQMEQQKVETLLWVLGLKMCVLIQPVDAGWKEVMGSVENRKQHLEESSRTLELFQTTQLQLSQWLQEKELMMSVLGPLSMDPNMLNTQKQQVQILLKEFEGRKPQYEQLNEAAVAITSASGKQDPAAEKVMEQLSVINKQWQALTGQLSQRDALIEQAVEKTTQFQELLRSLGESSAALESQLNDQQALRTQPDAVKKQLENTNAILTQLGEEKKKLKEAESLCSELLQLVTEEYLRANLTKQLESVSKPFKLLEEKAGRIRLLNSAFVSSQQFHQTSKDFQDWLDQKLQEQAEPQSISAEAETLRQNLKEHSLVQRALSEHEEPYNTIVKEGETLLQSTEGAEKVALQGQLSALRSQWEEVKRGAAEHAEKLNTAMERVQKYKEHAENLSSWLQECEARSNTVKFSVDPVEVESSLSQVKAIQKDVDKRRGQMELLSTAADSLLEVATKDVDAVKEEKTIIGKNVDKLAEDLQHKKESLEKLSQRLKEFSDTHKELKGKLEGTQKQLETNSGLGGQAFSNKNLTNMKAQQTNLEGVHNQIENLKSIAQGLVVEVPDAEGVTDLLLQVDSLETEHSSISKAVEETCSTLENKLQGIGQFQNTIREMFTNFTDLDDELDSMNPVGRDLETLRDQQGAIQNFIAQLQDLMNNTASAKETCKKMLETETSPDLLGLKRDLEALSKQSGKLMDRANGRKEQVQDILKHLEEFYTKLQTFSQTMGTAEEQEESQGPVGMETDVINQQLETFKVFQKEAIESLQTQLQELNWLGQGLIQNAPKGTSTKSLEHDLEEVNTRWNTLNKKVAERSAQLHEALLHCGRFQDALESLLSWLTDTEELVASQKPPSAEFKVVKAQIQEQRLLQRLLDDRRPTVELIKKEGVKVTELADSVDKEKIGREIECLGQRWDNLLKKAENRRKQLESILVVAQQFHETLEPLVEWLTATEKCLASSEPIGTQTSKLEEQISQHKALEEEIIDHGKSLYQAMSLGQALRTVRDEVVVIQGKLDGIKTRYAEISTMSSSVLATLNKALSLATKTQHTHEELSSWLEKVESELAVFGAQEPVGEQLTQVQDRQKALMTEVQGRRPVLDTLNEVSSALLELVPWRAREGLDKLVTEDNERYRSASDAIAQHVDHTGAAILKSLQFEQAADTELAWLTEAERKLSSLGDIKLEPEQTTAQLQEQKSFSMDIMRHKDAVDDIVKTGDAKVQSLLEKYSAVSQLNSERCLQLERTHSLACQFWETYEELWPWLQETQANFTQLPHLAIEYEALRQQQEELRQLRELIAEHKPHIDKMNKTGPQLVELSPVQGEPIRDKYQATDKLYAQLKADVKHRAAALDEAISKSTQFHDKIDPMLESLERIVERLRQPPSISVEVEKIREQISENKAVNMDLEKLQPAYETLKQRGEELITRSEGADKDLSAKAVQDKLDQMVFLWNDIQALLEEREAKLLDVMDLAEKFWCDHCALIVTIKDTQDLLRELEEPGVDPSVVKQQQESVESYREEIDGLQEELNVVQNLGTELMTACGEPDKPVIKKSLDEVNVAWETLNKTWKERVERLEEAMQAAVQFQDGLQGMFDWVDIMESKLDSMSPVGTDLETVKQQIKELKEFKGEAYQLQIEMERLNHQAGLLLKKVLEEGDRVAIQEPINELKMLWDGLDEKLINRQHKLEGALLALGQFQHALDELLAWLTHTEDLLNEQKKTSGDPKAIEIELAKHHVLQNDVLAHKSTVEAVNKAGSDLMESSAGEEACGLQSKLENLNLRWRGILEKTEQRRQLLDSALLQAQGFHGEIEDMQQWLKDTERQLLASKAVGGLPDTAREQLNAHLELCGTVEVKEELYQNLLHRGQQLIALTPEGQDSTTEQDLRNLKDKWECVQTKVAERKVKLEEAFAMATDFHNSLQDFINWLTQAEQTLTMLLQCHKIYFNPVLTSVYALLFSVLSLDPLMVVLILNSSAWTITKTLLNERFSPPTISLQFHESWTKLMEWLEESERALDSELEIANDPDKIKLQLAQHKEFQKALGGKHSVYDTTGRTGRALKDKTSLKDDNQKLDDMLCELRDKWDTVCGKSVERQNKLEEALLFSGQFTDALQALIDWLYKVEPQLAEDQPVHGDIDLVLNLIDSHKVFQKELGKRTGSVQALKRSARDLVENTHDDSSWVKVQMQELSTRWETVCALSVSKQTRLEQALCQAEEFHSTVHILLEWLAEAEQSLRFHGSLPDDEEALRSLIEQHKEFLKKLEEKRVALGKAISMGEAILAICHPDSITTVKHWNTIIKARFEEVTAWARQHDQRLSTALTELLATQELLESLLSWLQWAETTLTEKDKEPLPQEIEEVKALISEHQTFMEEMTRKQPDVDKVTKTHKRKATAEPLVQSQIPVLEKGRTCRKRSPTQNMYPATAQPQIETKNPRVNLLVSKWQQVWLLALDRRRKLNDALDRLEELKEFANFDFDVWRKRYMRWMNHKKSRVMDFFRRIDKDQDGKVTRQEFIEGILSSKFPTSRLEMSAVADIFDRDGDGYIDYYEFVAALHPNKDAYKPLTDADKIEDEVTRQVAKCKCPKRFQVEQIGANKYRFYLGNQFGDSQQLRLVRILRSTVMVRVGGGWMALDEFLVKNDPCRAKGRTNVELREKFILPEGTTQVMASFRYRGRRSRPSSRGASPNRSNSSHSCPAQHNPAAAFASKVGSHRPSVKSRSSKTSLRHACLFRCLL
uniref:Dystonin n=1 Tax=Astyanax mexicanus TaxID=7994 RepID=A0A8B9KKY6_ASTMX